jgi:hypothetical protein
MTPAPATAAAISSLPPWSALYESADYRITAQQMSKAAVTAARTAG